MGKRGLQGLLLKAFGGHDHLLTVVSVEHEPGNFQRIRFHSDTLFSAIEPVPTAWLRLWLPDVDGSDIEYQRAYTIFDANPESGEFSVDFLIHEPVGPGAAWSLAAQIGDQIAGVSLGSSRFVPQPDAKGYLLIGDAAAVPALRSIVEVLEPEAQIRLYLEENGGEERDIELPGHPGLSVTWVRRQSDSSLLEAVAKEDWTGWYPWVTTESGSLKRLRKHFKETYGMDKTTSYAQAYWIKGRAMGKSRE